MAVLRGEDGYILNIMRRRPTDGESPHDFQVGFLFDTPDEVHAMHTRLAADGVRAGDVEHMTRRGITSDTFYCFAPNNVLVEVSCYDSTSSPDSTQH